MSMNGTIKRLVSDKGFGFIAAGDGTEYFFHQSACTGTAFDQLFGEGGTDAHDGGPAFDRCVDGSGAGNTFVDCEFQF